jgi:uncharacterized protein YkwD
MKISRLFKISCVAIISFFLFSFTNSAYKKIAPTFINNYDEVSLINMEHDIFVLINAHRKSIGLQPLQLSEVESTVAGKHSYNMASGKLPFGHKDLKKRMEIIASQIGYISETGENVAYGQMNAHEVVDGWLKSSGHRKNIEGDFTLTGIGVAKDKKGMVYYTQVFTK